MLPASTYTAPMSDAKDTAHLRARMLHVASFRGSAAEMLAQLQHFQATFRIPLAPDAELIVESASALSHDGTGHALSGSLLSTYTKRSILLPFMRECVFTANTDTADIYVNPAEPAYPLRMQSALPAPLGHHGICPHSLRSHGLYTSSVDSMFSTHHTVTALMTST